MRVLCLCVGVCVFFCVFFFFQAEDGIRCFCLSRGLGDVYRSQPTLPPCRTLPRVSQLQHTAAHCQTLPPWHTLLPCHTLPCVSQLQYTVARPHCRPATHCRAYLNCSILPPTTQLSLPTIYRGVIPFVAIQLFAVAVLWIWPGLVHWLPGVLSG